MTIFNTKDFSLQKVILERVQKESDIAWGKRKSEVKLPKFNKIKIKKDSAWWWNFFKSEVKVFIP